jgi:hypothetical protein
MATVTKGRTFVSGEVVTPTKLNNLVDLATVTGIVDADVSATAAIADSKLAAISTAGKVSGNAITSGTIGGSTAISTTGTISSGTITANLTGTVTGTVTGNASGLSSPASNGLAKAWVNFNGAGTYTLGTPTAATIRSSHNVSTITKNANGDFTVNFSSAFPNANYAVMVTAQGPANNALSAIRAGAAATMVTTTSVRVSFLDTSAGPENPNTASVVIFGNW